MSINRTCRIGNLMNGPQHSTTHPVSSESRKKTRDWDAQHQKERQVIYHLDVRGLIDSNFNQEQIWAYDLRLTDSSIRSTLDGQAVFGKVLCFLWDRR